MFIEIVYAAIIESEVMLIFGGTQAMKRQICTTILSNFSATSDSKNVIDS